MFRRFHRLLLGLLCAFCFSFPITDSASAEPAFWREGQPGPPPGRPDSFAELAAELSPAVVFIEVQKQAPSSRLEEHLEQLRDQLQGEPGERPSPFGGRGGIEPPATASGSGFVLSPDGFIATNDHVVAGASKIEVRFLDGNKLEAEIVGRDRTSDLALIKVSPGDPLVTAPLGDSDQIRVGDWVVAIGNPYGFEHSVTVGILSAKGRTLNMSNYDDFLQTDASINPGNSGGPLIDTAGRVIGINSAIRATITGDALGIGFAIPINIVKALLPQLRENGSATRGWLGVQIQEVTPAVARVFGIEGPRGALIGMVLPSSPAVGLLEGGDIIVRFGDSPIRRVTDLPRAVGIQPPGTEVEVEIIRDGAPKVLRIKLGSLASDSGEATPTPELADKDSSPASLLESWGFEVETVKPTLRQRLGAGSQEAGLRVTDVTPNSPADREGLRQGDLILEANRREVRTTEELSKSLVGEILALSIRREDQQMLLILNRLEEP